MIQKGEKMPIELASLGTSWTAIYQLGQIVTLAKDYGLEPIQGLSMCRHNSPNLDGKAKSLICVHFHIPGASMMGAETKPNVVRFMVEAMKLPGVYTACPECAKRRFWEEQERTLVNNTGTNKQVVTLESGGLDADLS